MTNKYYANYRLDGELEEWWKDIGENFSILIVGKFESSNSVKYIMNV